MLKKVGYEFVTVEELSERLTKKTKVMASVYITTIYCFT